MSERASQRPQPHKGGKAHCRQAAPHLHQCRQSFFICDLSRGFLEDNGADPALPPCHHSFFAWSPENGLLLLQKVLGVRPKVHDSVLSPTDSYPSVIGTRTVHGDERQCSWR